MVGRLWRREHRVPSRRAAAAIGGAETQGGSFQLECQLRLIVAANGRIEEVLIVKDTIGRWVARHVRGSGINPQRRYLA